MYGIIIIIIINCSNILSNTVCIFLCERSYLFCEGLSTYGRKSWSDLLLLWH